MAGTLLRRAIPVILGCAVSLSAASVSAGEDGKAAAEQILKAADLRKGICLLIEFSDETLAGALHDGGVSHVHGISSDRAKVEAARGAFQKRGKYGEVAFDHSDLKSLPYVDGIANIVIVEDFKGVESKGLAIAEVVRVLAPYGTLFIKGFNGTVPGTAKGTSGPWTLYLKNLPEGADEWTHVEHDPERTSVSRDMVVVPPTGIRWMAGLLYPYAMADVGFASTDGRNFYWYWAHHPGRYGPREEKSRIVCRDSFNGVLLWEKEIPRKVRGATFVAIKGRVYGHLGGEGGLAALDAATGEELCRFEESKEHPESEILVKDGILVQCANGIRAFDAATGKQLWDKPNGLMTGDMILAGGDKLYYLFREGRDKPTYLVCSDFETGKEHWRAEQRMKFKKED